MPAPDRKHALFSHCVEVFNAMMAESEPYELREGQRPPPIPQIVGGPLHATQAWPDDAPVGAGEGPRIYTGYLTKLFKQLHLAVPYYTSVMENLKRMKCVEQLKRGGGKKPSQWALWHPPDRMLFNYMQTTEKLQADGTHKKTIQQILEQRITDLDAELKRQILRINQLEMLLEREGEWSH